MNSTSVAVVVPVHNGVDQTVRCLKALRESTVLPSWILVVDDGSTDGTADVLRRDFPEVEVLPGDGQLWWAGAMNEGISRALELGTDFVVALNNDCVVRPNTLERLLQSSLSRRNAIVCSKVVFGPDGQRILSAGGKLNWWWRGPALRGSDELDTGQWDAGGVVDWVTGMGVLFPAICFHSIGGFDAQNFPQYKADVDFSIRARKGGFSLVYEPGAVVWNDISQTGLQVSNRPTFADLRTLLTSRNSQHNLRETVRFFRRHSPKMALPFGLLSRLLILVTSLVWRRVR